MASAAMSLILAGCGAPAAPAATAAPPKPASVKVVNLAFLAFAPYWIAYENGYFKEQTLDVELVNFATQEDGVVQLLSGNADVAAGNVTAGVFNAIIRGSSIRLTADKGYLDPAGCQNQALTARQGAFSSTNPTTEEMRGKKMTLSTGSWLDYWKEKYLALKGLKPEDMTKVEVPVASTVDAMTKGQIDIVGQNEPWTTRLRDAGHVTLEPSSNALLPNSQSAIMLFGPKMLGDNADVGKRFMVAYLKAVRKYNEGKTPENVAILAKYTKLDPDLVKRMCWSQMRNDGEVNVASLRDFQNWAVERKLLDRALTEQELFDPVFVRHAVQVLGSK